MDATQNPLQQAKAVGQVVKQLAVPELVVRSMTVLKTALKTISEPASKTVVDQLTKAFETFGVNLLELVQP
jgi:hypothetical protein